MEYLAGWTLIGKTFGVSCGIARKWYDEGAPIIILPNGVPVTKAGDLWEWLRAQYG